MKLLMIICPESRRDQAAALLEEHGVRAFTELPEVVGEGLDAAPRRLHIEGDLAAEQVRGDPA